MLLNMENITEITNSWISIWRHWSVVGYAKYKDRWYTMDTLVYINSDELWYVRGLFIKDVWYT